MPSVRFNRTGFVYMFLFSSGIKYISFPLDSVAVTVCHYRQENILIDGGLTLIW